MAHFTTQTGSCLRLTVETDVFQSSQEPSLAPILGYQAIKPAVCVDSSAKRETAQKP